MSLGEEGTQRERVVRQPGGEESGTATSQETPGPPAAGRDQEGPIPVSVGGGGPADTLILNFWPPEL